ncbi:hypothetical protein BRM3_13370 [Brachybacterium huguangmaarense]|uniref:VTT domain-containing protein n=1 Tax=Brachybacterium huguangmaarense TaxID=1652028 RepID=A0ABY6G1L5_9MICO|nr:hypothetical protein [Brachybacterium huguangmaarense]UYG16573.1 hypothetical protein BRM3_13370 [Brachybacterium huguangmaarense]
MKLLLVLLGAVGYAALGALIPLFNTEIVAATVPVESHVAPLLVALALGLGQTLGKLPYWLAGRGAERWSRLRAPREKRPSRLRLPRFLVRLGAWIGRMGDAVADWGRRGPWRMMLVTFLSGAIAIPPFIVWPVVVGAIDRSWWRFFVPAMAGRTLLFLVIASIPELVVGTR